MTKKQMAAAKEHTQALEAELAKYRSIVGSLRNALYELLEYDLINLVEEKVKDEVEYRHPY